MKLRANELRDMAESNRLTVEQLAAAVERPGLTGYAAVSAVRNWIMGRDHPRCQRADIQKLAEAVGAEIGQVARFVSLVNAHRGSPRKARLVTAVIKGRAFDEANDVLRFSTQRAAVNVRKALNAAMDEAREAGVDTGSLMVAEARVDGATHIKRFQPKDRGRAHPILKRTSHITVGLQAGRPTRKR